MDEHLSTIVRGLKNWNIYRSKQIIAITIIREKINKNMQKIKQY